MTQYDVDNDVMQVARVGHYLVEEIKRGVAPQEAIDAIAIKLGKLAAILIFEVLHDEDVVSDDEPTFTAPDPAVHVAEVIAVPPLVAVNSYGDVIAETTETEVAAITATEASLGEIMAQIRARVLEPVEDIDAREAAALAEVAAALPEPVEDEVVHPARFA